MLLVEGVLALRGWASLAPWDALYADLPSRQAKLRVADRAAVAPAAAAYRTLDSLDLDLL